MARKLLTLDDHVIGLERFDDREQAFKDEVHERLQGRCEPDHVTGCLIYTGAWEQSGQGKVRVGTRVYGVTRVSAWLYIPGFRLWDSRKVAHSPACNSPACFNHEHLVVLEGQAESLALQRKKGTLGRACPRLNRRKARELRRMFAEGAAVGDLEKIFDIRAPSVVAVIDGVTWREVANGDGPGSDGGGPGVARVEALGGDPRGLRCVHGPDGQ